MPVSRFAFRSLVLSLFAFAAAACAQAQESGEAFPEVYNTQDAKDQLGSAVEALGKWKLPEGFHATLFAAEPQVRQPIAIATDERGRLWVAENYTYAEGAVGFEEKLRDRIVILEDTDGDGKSDKRTVFWDKGHELTSIEIGQGGVFALCAPELLFIPDRDRDDKPDGEAEVLLDGWNDDAVRHNIVNGLRWGPDGWLYGRHGILATSQVGRPGAPAAERTPINCGIWRYHPTRRVFEAVAHGTTNPWGFDFDDNGQMFFINTVIGHLWHIVPGAHYKRMYGVDLNPHTYNLIDQCADHFHWDTKEAWSDIRKLGVTATTSEAGGGHAHSGLMIYLGGNWPEEYRGGVFTINLHGMRLNHDVLQRKGSGYVATHDKDFCQTTDRWFRGIDLIYGADGGVYLADWSDVGECHENDGVHRTSGRIYKFVYGKPKFDASLDLAKKSNAELIDLQTEKNDWFVRQARRILQDRAAAGADMGEALTELRSRYESEKNVARKLRLLWCANVIGGAERGWLKAIAAKGENEHLVAWSLRLLADADVTGDESAALASVLAPTAAQNKSALVRLFAASACERLAHEHRWEVAERLAAHAEDAGDAMLPLMIWYAVEPAVAQFPEQAVKLVEHSQIPLVRQYVVRRLTENIETRPEAVNRIVELALSHDSAFRRDVLLGMSEALEGWRKAEAPPAWADLASAVKNSPEDVQRLVREISVVFGDGRALGELRQIALGEGNDVTARLAALRVLADSRERDVLPLLKSLTADRVLSLPPEGRERAIDTLSSRLSFAKALLSAVRDKRIEARDISASSARQIRSLGDAATTHELEELWGVMRDAPEEKKKQMAVLKSEITEKRSVGPDLSAGREVFQKTCGKCHVLYGEGGKIGPDLTGANRQNLDYLVENILDPSATMANDYKVSLLALADGRTITGVILQQNERTLVVQTKDERLTLDRLDVEEISRQNASLMPEGLLTSLEPKQIRDLFAYLQSGK